MAKILFRLVSVDKTHACHLLLWLHIQMFIKKILSYWFLTNTDIISDSVWTYGIIQRTKGFFFYFSVLINTHVGMITSSYIMSSISGTKETIKRWTMPLGTGEVQCFVARKLETSITSDWLSPHSWQRLSAFPPNPANKQQLNIFITNKKRSNLSGGSNLKYQLEKITIEAVYFTHYK